MNYKVFLGVVALMGASVYGSGQNGTPPNGVPPQATTQANGAQPQTTTQALTVWQRITGKAPQAPAANAANAVPPAASGVMVQSTASSQAQVVQASVGSEAACKAKVESFAVKNINFGLVLEGLQLKFPAGVFVSECAYLRDKHLMFFKQDPDAANKASPINVKYWMNEVANRISLVAIDDEKKKIAAVNKANKTAYAKAKKEHKEAARIAMPKPAVVSQGAVTLMNPAPAPANGAAAQTTMPPAPNGVAGGASIKTAPNGGVGTLLQTVPPVNGVAGAKPAPDAFK